MKKNTNETVACRLKTSIGGQALMEGIMMRGPKKTFMVVRNTQGELVREEVATAKKERPAFCRWPIIRGVLGYVDSMTLGYKCLMRSAELSGLEDVVEEKPKKKKQAQEQIAPTEETAQETVETVEEKAEEKTEEKKEDKLPAWTMTLIAVISTVLGIGIGLAVFLWLPSFLYELVAPHVGFMNTDNVFANSIWKSAFEGILRILLLVGYMAAISLMKDIRRTFMYHGAEHKTIFCYEAGLELTVENVRKMKRFHPRCGTSFLILMLLVSVFITFFIDPVTVAITGQTLPLVLRLLVKLLLLPLIVGLGYELIKLAGRHDNLFTRAISAPGVWLQHITVFEPTDDMIECAIEAVKPVIPDDGSDNW